MKREIKLGRIYKHYTGRYVMPESIDEDHESKQVMIRYKDILSNTLRVDSLESFLSKVPENIESTQEYQFELADHISMIPGNELARYEVDSLGCVFAFNENCLCEKFRSMKCDGTCDAKIFKKVWIGEQL